MRNITFKGKRQAASPDGTQSLKRTKSTIEKAMMDGVGSRTTKEKGLAIKERITISILSYISKSLMKEGKSPFTCSEELKAEDMEGLNLPARI